MAVGGSREKILSDVRLALKREVKPASSAMPVACSTVLPEESARLIIERCQQRRAELIDQFDIELKRVGGLLYRAPTSEAALQYILGIALERQSTTVIGCDAVLVDGIDFKQKLAERDIRYITETADDEFIRTAAVAGIGLSTVEFALADTGTLVVAARKGEARSISLLPPVHIAVVKTSQVISGLNDLFPLLRCQVDAGGGDLNSAITFITGPSRTADIELTLVVGVHGPQHLYVILVEG